MRFSLACLTLVSSLALVSCSSPAPDRVGNTCLSGTSCSGACVQLATDGANCGACGVACTDGRVCSAGHCTLSCAAPLATCGEGAAARCADLRSDPTSCGRCGHACADGQLCAGGECVETCSAPLTACSDGTRSSCVDLRFDPGHCGSCDAACSAGQVCSGGDCRPACSAPLTACGTGPSSVCADLRNDPAHCGSCATVCAAGQMCAAGACGPSCAAPLTVCGEGDAARCVDLRSDVSSCGTCGHACAAGQACLAGACVTTCEGAGGTLCDGSCVDLDTDNANCGKCGTACPSGTVCQAGACAATCPASQIPCDGVCLDASDDPQNCGACGNVCTTGICRAGACAAPACEGTLGLPGRPLAPPSSPEDLPWDRAVADLDGDGVPDLAMTRPNEGVVEIRYVHAPGVFGRPLTIAVADHPFGIAAADVDGDGKVDLVACGAVAISLLRNHGDGTFDRSDFPAQGTATQNAVIHCALGDLDGDGRPDLVLSYNRDAKIAVAHNTGGAFAAPVPYASDKPQPWSVALADLDGNGTLDVLVLHSPLSIPAGAADIDKGSVSVYLGIGDGTLGSLVTYAAGETARDMVVADLDGDGWLDVATAAFGDHAVAVLRNDGHGGLLARTAIPVNNTTTALTAGDLDGNGTIDLVVVRSFDDVVILRNDGHAGFTASEVYPLVSDQIALADATGDGDLDLYVASNRPQIIPQEAGRLVVAPQFPDSGRHVVLIDLDGDGRLDAVSASGSVNILRGLPDGGFASAPGPTASGVFEVAAGDLDGDGDVDLVLGGIGIVLSRNRGNGTFDPVETINNEDIGGWSVTLADLDGDGDLDLVAARSLQLPGTLQVYFNDGHGVFRPGPRFNTGWDTRTPAVGHLTGGGSVDIAAPNWMDGTVSVFQGHPDGSFTPFATLSVPPLSPVAVIADVTQDGRADLIAAGSGDLSALDLTIRIYPGLDHGLGAAIDLSTGAFPDDLAVADLDSDGRPDIVAAGGGIIAFHRALPGGGFAAPLLYPTAVASGGLAIRDLNGDLRPDVVALGQFSGSLNLHLNRCLSP